MNAATTIEMRKFIADACLENQRHEVVFKAEEIKGLGMREISTKIAKALFQNGLARFEKNNDLSSDKVWLGAFEFVVVSNGKVGTIRSAPYRIYEV